MRLDKTFHLAVFLVLATAPLLFGARHPLIHGLYTCALLLAGGGWLIVNRAWQGGRPAGFARLTPALLLLFIVLTAIALPSFLVGLLSPVRADYLAHGARIAGLDNAAASLSYYAPAAMFYGVYGAGLLLFFHACRTLLGPEEMLRKALWVITLVGLFEAAYGLLQATNPELGVLWLPSSPASYAGCARGTIIYRNQYASFLNLCWPMALALGISLYRPALAEIDLPRRQREELSLAARAGQLMQKAAVPLWSAGLMILAVIFSRSRGGILVMLLTGALFIYLLSFPRRLKILFAGSLLLFVCLYGGTIGFEEVIARFATFFESGLARFAVWKNSLAMLWDHFLTGIGMGSYEFLSPVYLKDVPATVWYDRAHNEYVELAIELGLPAMLLFLAWAAMGMAGFARVLLRRKRERPGPSRLGLEDIAAVGAFCGIAGLMLHAWTDFVWRLPATVIYAVVLLAMLSGVREAGAESEADETVLGLGSMEEMEPGD